MEDRYSPDVFAPIGSSMGRSDVLQVDLGPGGFATNRGAQSALFYDTQGGSTNLTPGAFPAGSAYASVDLYVPSSWSARQTTNYNIAALWGLSANSGGDVAYPVIAFANSDKFYGPGSGSGNGSTVEPSGAGGRIQVYDSTGNWHVLAEAINYNGWNTLRFEIKAGRNEFYLNGKLVYTDTTVAPNVQEYLKTLYLNSVNNNNDPYSVFFSNLLVGLLLDPSDFNILGSVPGMNEFYNFSSLGDLITRRGLLADQHFSLKNYTWAYGGGLTGNFRSNDSVEFDGTAYFGRFGIDVIQPMEQVRIGLTSSGGRAFTHDAVGGSADSENFSVGGYLTYASPQFYADLLSEYAWGNWDVDVPGQDRVSLDSRTYTISAEMGTSIPVAKDLIVVPNGQLVFLNTRYDDVAFTLVKASYDSDTTVIGRMGARLQYEVPDLFAATRVYLGVSAVKDLAGSTSTILSSAAFPGGNDIYLPSGFSETAAQFATGFDVNLSTDARVFADASYLVGSETDAFRGSGGVAIKW